MASWKQKAVIGVTICAVVGGLGLVGAQVAIIGMAASDGVNTHKEAYQTVKKSGYSNIQMSTDYKTYDLKCNPRSMQRVYKFSANNPNREKVDGTVCCGILKKQGCEIKY